MVTLHDAKIYVMHARQAGRNAQDWALRSGQNYVVYGRARLSYKRKGAFGVL